MTDAPKNLERIEQGGTHDLDITWLNRAKELGGVPTSPDGYDSGDPSATVTAEVKVYDNAASDPDDPANWSTPGAGLNPPTISTLLDGGTTGKVLARLSVPSNAKTSADLLTQDTQRWGIRWATTINGVAIELFEFFEILTAGGGDFGDGLFCTVAEVRAASAFTDARDIDDDTVEAMIRRAQAETLHALARKRNVLLLEAAPGDTTRTKWRVPDDHGWLFSDSYGDLEDATTTTTKFLDDDNNLTLVAVASKDTERNILTLASAAATSDEVVLTAWLSNARDPDPDLVCEAVVVLATHYIDLRAQQPGSIHLADPSGGRNLVGLKDTTHLKEWKRLVARIQRGSGGGIGAASIDTRAGKRGGIL